MKNRYLLILIVALLSFMYIWEELIKTNQYQFSFLRNESLFPASNILLELHLPRLKLVSQDELFFDKKYHLKLSKNEVLKWYQDFSQIEFSLEQLVPQSFEAIAQMTILTKQSETISYEFGAVNELTGKFLIKKIINDHETHYFLAKSTFYFSEAYRNELEKSKLSYYAFLRNLAKNELSFFEYTWTPLVQEAETIEFSQPQGSLNVKGKVTKPAPPTDLEVDEKLISVFWDKMKTIKCLGVVNNQGQDRYKEVVSYTKNSKSYPLILSDHSKKYYLFLDSKYLLEIDLQTLPLEFLKVDFFWTKIFPNLKDELISKKWDILVSDRSKTNSYELLWDQQFMVTQNNQPVSSSEIEDWKILWCYLSACHPNYYYQSAAIVNFTNDELRNFLKLELNGKTVFLKIDGQLLIIYSAFHKLLFKYPLQYNFTHLF